MAVFRYFLLSHKQKTKRVFTGVVERQGEDRLRLVVKMHVTRDFQTTSPIRCELKRCPQSHKYCSELWVHYRSTLMSSLVSMYLVAFGSFSLVITSEAIPQSSTLSLWEAPCSPGFPLDCPTRHLLLLSAYRHRWHCRPPHLRTLLVFL